MVLDIKTVATSLFHTFTGNTPPTTGNLNGWDQAILRRYQPFLQPTMAQFGLDFRNLEHVNWVLLLAEIDHDLPTERQVDSCVWVFPGDARRIRSSEPHDGGAHRSGESARPQRRLQARLGANEGGRSKARETTRAAAPEGCGGCSGWADQEDNPQTPDLKTICAR